MYRVTGEAEAEADVISVPTLGIPRGAVGVVSIISPRILRIGGISWETLNLGLKEERENLVAKNAITRNLQVAFFPEISDDIDLGRSTG